MEEPNSTDSLVVAATNHSGILDEALARRFDELIEYEVPDADAARAVVERRLGKFKVNAVAWGRLSGLLDGLSQAELVRAADSVVKDTILSGQDQISIERLDSALKDRARVRRRFSLRVEP